MQKRIACIVVVILLQNPFVFGQETASIPSENNLDPTQNRMDWMPTLLNANSELLFNTVQHNGNLFSWQLRGIQNTAVFVDGIHWSMANSNWNTNHLYQGFYNALHSIASVGNGVFAEQIYYPQSHLFYATSFPYESKKQWAIQTNIANRNYGNALSMQYHSGRMLHDWRYRIAGFVQWMPPASFVIGYKKSAGALWSAERNLPHRNSIQFSLIWNFNDQSKVNSTLKEMYELSGQRDYQSNWGWYHQKPYFPSTSQNHTAVVTVQFNKKWDVSQTMQWSNALAFGKQGQTSLEWNHTADPRPDYYRYLPSYLPDSTLRNTLTDWFFQHPSALQISFDALEKINRASPNHSAYYMVNQAWNQFVSWQGAIRYTQNLKQYWNFILGANYGLDRVRNYNQIKNLLGGSFYNNYNYWTNDDGSVSSFQNDITHPDRKITVGEKWGPDYAIDAIHLKPWLQLHNEGPRWENYFGMSVGLQGFRRMGFTINGLYPNDQVVPVAPIFPNWDFKWQALFKYSGRFYLRAIAFIGSTAPQADAYFLQPGISALPNPYAHSLQEQSGDLSFIYHAPVIKWTSSLYWKRISNASIQKMFYHDAFASFVYGIAGDLQTQYTGWEASVETQWIPQWQIGWVGNLQQNIYMQNVPYRILFLNDLHILDEGILWIRHLPASNSPSWTQGLSMIYQATSTWKLGAHYILAFQRPIEMDLFRRSSWVKNKVDNLSWQQMQQNSFLQNQGVLNVFVSKNFLQKWNNKLVKWYASASVRNALNTWIPVFAYEQTRFDYVHFNAQRYAIKYLMDQGLSFSLHVQLQFQ
ncbi:MAG: hypothetical protein RLZ56_182 [Bacteroidota bacterium]|jgi:hypothetical protein